MPQLPSGQGAHINPPRWWSRSPLPHANRYRSCHRQIMTHLEITARGPQRQHRQRRPLYLLLSALVVALTASCSRSEPRQPDLPKQPDRWVSSVALDTESRARYIGRTKDFVITSVTTVKDVNTPRTISVGDDVEGLRIGAIQCSFYWRDTSYGGEQYMWRDRWGCKAGRSRQEVENAVGEDGTKHFDYIHVSPVHLAGD